MVHRLIEVKSKFEMCNCRWEVVNLLVKVMTKGEINEIGRKMVYRLIEI